MRIRQAGEASGLHPTDACFGGVQAACEGVRGFAAFGGVPLGLQAFGEVVPHMLTTCISSARLVRAGRTA